MNKVKIEKQYLNINKYINFSFSKNLDNLIY